MKCTIYIICLFSLWIKVKNENNITSIYRKICTALHSIPGCRHQYIPQFWGTVLKIFWTRFVTIQPFEAKLGTSLLKARIYLHLHLFIDKRNIMICFYWIPKNVVCVNLKFGIILRKWCILIHFWYLCSLIIDICPFLKAVKMF